MVVAQDGELEREIGTLLAQQQFVVHRETSYSGALRAISSGAEHLLVVVDSNSIGKDHNQFISEVHKLNAEIRLLLLPHPKTGSEKHTADRFEHAEFLPTGVTQKGILDAVNKVLRGREADLKYFPEIGNIISCSLALEYRTDEIKPGRLARYFANQLILSKACDILLANLFEIAVYESLINAIEHGNLSLSSDLKASDFSEKDYFANLRQKRITEEEFAGRKIKMEFTMQSGRVELSIQDEGAGFNYKEIMEKIGSNEPDNFDLCHGRGLLMISHCVDEIRFNELGNRITLVKDLSKNILDVDYCA